MKFLLIIIAPIFVASSHSVPINAAEKPIKVFILAGQSNMEGHAKISTFDYIGDDPATIPLLRMMRDSQGRPVVCENARISYLTGSDDHRVELAGKLTAGYGSLWGQDDGKIGEKIGPEFTFGLTMDAAFDEPVLLIKTAWGARACIPIFGRQAPARIS